MTDQTPAPEAMSTKLNAKELAAKRYDEGYMHLDNKGRAFDITNRLRVGKVLLEERTLGSFVSHGIGFFLGCSFCCPGLWHSRCLLSVLYAMRQASSWWQLTPYHPCALARATFFRIDFSR